MKARHMHWIGPGMAIAVATTVAAGCATQGAAKATPPAPAGEVVAAAMAADRGFNITYQGACPHDAHRFGPPDSVCPAGSQPECVQVKHGSRVKFQRAGNAGGEFVIDFTPESPLDANGPKHTSIQGVVDQPTRASTSKNEFQFTVKAPPGTDGCTNVDPEIILN